MSDPVDHPQHYTSHPSGIEAIEICEHLDFCLGNAVKYLFRAGHKDPLLQDLRKSAWYLRRYASTKTLMSLPFDERVMTVRNAETAGSVLDDVLRHLFGRPGNVKGALARVEREIERVQEGK